MPAKITKTRKPELQREAPPVLIVVAVVLLVIALGVGGFYVYNGGWKTAAQQDEEYKHNLMPLMAAKHGDMQPLEVENKLRKEHGQPLLQVPKDRQQRAYDSRQKLADLQKQLMSHQNKQAAP